MRSRKFNFQKEMKSKIKTKKIKSKSVIFFTANNLQYPLHYKNNNRIALR